MTKMDCLIGMTESAVRLYTLMGAMLKEFTMEIRPEGIVAVKSQLEYAAKKVDEEWIKRHGIPSTVLRSGIIGEMVDGPKEFLTIFSGMKNEESGGQFDDVDEATVRKEIELMLEVGLLTKDPDEMWKVDYGKGIDS